MPTPALSIPIRANLDDFKKSMSETSSLTRTAVKNVLNQFADMNKGLAAAGAASGAAWALGIIGRITLVVGAFKLMGDAIDATRNQLKQMVDIADKSQSLGVSPKFFQSFLTESQKLKIGADELETALASAFNASKDKSPIDINQWETADENINSVEKALRVYNATLAKTAGTQLEGLVLFRDADTQEKKIMAVLAAMIQLKQIGQDAAALDLGERMFGSQFVDRIRQGKTSAESLLSSMKAAAANADSIFPNDLVMRAKEVDEQLRLSQDRLSRALNPSFNDLAATMLTIKGYWADVVDLIGRAVEVTNRLGITSETARKKDELGAVKEAIKNGTGIWGAYQVPEGFLGATPRADLKKRRDRLQGDVDSAEREPNVFPEKPVPSRGTGGTPTKKPVGSETDKFETSADSIDKRTAALQAEAASIDLGTAARERAKITAQLETVAKQANIAAGLGENVVTKDQRDRINEVADAYSKAALAMEKAHVASSIKFGAQTSLLDPSDVAIASQLRNIYPDVATALGSVEAQAMRTNEALHGISSTMSSTMTTGLTDILDGTKSVGQGFEDMSKTIIRALEEAIIKMMIVAPIMRGLQGLTGGIGDFIGAGGNPIAGLTGKADGGYIRGPGSGTSDSIPARLSNGEFVVKAASVSRPGVRGQLERLNSGSLHMANGGYVGGGGSQVASSAAPQFNVSVMNYGQDKATVEKKDNGSGGFDLNVLIGQAAASEMAKPGSALRQVTDQRGRIASR